MILAYWKRAVLVITIASGTAGGCAQDSSPPLIAATATIENLLPVDGCSYLVKIDNMQYAPDEESRAAIIAHMLPSVATVAVRYRLTGATGQVACGNASGHLDLPEITLVFEE